MSGRGISLWFDKDIRDIKGNPHRIETPFGFASVFGTGDIFLERDALESAIEKALQFIDEDNEAYKILVEAGKQ